MDSVVLIFVPTDASREEFETSLREYLASIKAEEMKPTAAPNGPGKVIDNDHMPLWSWFISNPPR